MRVLHFVPKFSSLSETFIYDYVTELERQGVTNTVVTSRRANADARPFPRVRVIEAPSRLHPRRLWYRALETVGLRERHTSGWTQIREQCAALVRERTPDVLHAHFGKTGVRVAPVATTLGVPLVVSFHGHDAFTVPHDPFWRRKYETLFDRATAVTAVSQTMADHLVTLGAAPDTVHVVHVGTRTDEYDYQLPTGPLHEWLSVGRLVEKKGFADCLRAFRAYRQQVPNATLDVVGDGAQMDKLRALVDGSDLESAVRLLGRRPHSDVLDRMADADAFVLCSKEARNGDREGIPTVLMEAQAIGLPVVATRHSGIPEVIPETNHDLLAPEGDIDAIADRLLRLSGLSDAELRSRSARGREKIEAEFNLPRVVETLRGLYTDCAAERV